MSDESVPPGEIPPSGIDRGPQARTIGLVLLALWIALHVGTPLSYYLSDDTYDERFAWRMFSAVREQQCQLGAFEDLRSGPRPIAMQAVLPAPWISLLQRNRPAVIRAFLAWRCDSDAAPTEVSLEHTCRSVAGDLLPTVHRRLSCSDGTYTESTDEAPE